ncbi:hypothetical protein [Nakamurella sp.]|uniref:hypothetical protein n=1 Tax=Nakamurella sp. TaxID=1869182 RepID=UPI003B3A8C5A
MTNEGGRFHLVIKDGVASGDDEISVTAFKDDKQISEPQTISRSRVRSPLMLTISASEEFTNGYLQEVVTLKPTEGRLFPREHLQQIYAAINIYGNTRKKYSINGPNNPGLTCPLPEMNDRDDVLLYSWEAVRGSSHAAQRLQGTLDLIELSMIKRGTPPPRIDFEGKDWQRYIDSRRDRPPRSGISTPMIPLDRMALLMGAAKLIAGEDDGRVNRNMNIVMGQLIEFYRCVTIYRTCRDAVLGDPLAQREVRRMIGIWGEDCPGREPIPDTFPGKGDPLDGMDYPIDPELDERLPCLHDLTPGSKSIEVLDYAIDAIVPAFACPGSEVTIKGRGFGTAPGKVIFPGKAIASSIEVDATSWQSTRIKVIVPANATYGSIGINFLYHPGARKCGIVTGTFHRNVSRGARIFTGGKPRIDGITFTRDNISFDPAGEVARPGEKVKMTYSCSKNAPTHEVHVQYSPLNVITGEFNVPSDQERFDYIFTEAPNSRTLQLSPPLNDITVKALCTIKLSNECGTTVETAEFIIHKPATVRLTGLEITQVTQFFRADEHMNPLSGQTSQPDNSVPLIADKPTLVRVYYSSDQDPKFNLGRIFGVQVGLAAVRDDVSLGPLGCINAGNLIARSSNLVVNERGNPERSANFILPTGWIEPTVRRIPLEGSAEAEQLVNTPLELTASLFLDQREPWKRDSVSSTADVLKVSGLVFNRARKLRIVAVRFSINTPRGRTFAEPSLGRCVRELERAGRGFPVPTIEILRPLVPENRVIDIDADLTAPSNGDGCGPGWGALLDRMTGVQFSEFGSAISQGKQPRSGSNVIWAGIVSRNVPVGPIAGCTRGDMSIVALRSDQHVMHEFCHACGQEHPVQLGTPESDADPNFPNYRLVIDNGDVSCGEFGVAVGDIDRNDSTSGSMVVFDPDHIRDTMDRDRGGAQPYNDAWMSPHTYMGVMETFLGPVARGDSDSALSLPRFPTPEREQFVLSGMIDRNAGDENEVVLNPLFHEQLPVLPEKGNKSPYVIEATNSRGILVYRGSIRIHPRTPRRFTFWQQIPYMDDITKIQIKKRELVLAQFDRREQPPRVVNLETTIDGSVRLLNWSVEQAHEYWCCVELSCDGRGTWTRMTEFNPLNSYSFDTADIGGGPDCRLRVVVTNGFNTTSAETEQFELPLAPPDLFIIGIPEEGRVISERTYDVQAIPVYTVGIPHQSEMLWYLDGEQIAEGDRVEVNFAPGSHLLQVIPKKFRETEGTILEVISIDASGEGGPEDGPANAK